MRAFADSSDGSIPAGAGEPSSGMKSAEYKWVYPRGCGGAGDGAPTTRMATGLSPRVRGSLAVMEPIGNRPGSIPAGAGEPSYAGLSSDMEGVYPRGCGGAPQPART